MKKFLSLLIVICLLSLSLISCGENRKYKEALNLLDEGEYAAAYEILKKLGDYKDSKEILKHFRYVLKEVTYSQTDYTGKVVKDSFSIQYTYNADNLLSQKQDGNITTVYTYDETGNLIKSLLTNSDFSQTFEYAYDSDGNLLKETFYQRETIFHIYEYAYDANGNMTQKSYRERRFEWDLAPSLQYVIDYTYDANNRLIKKVTTRSEENVSTVEYVYNAQGQLIEESYSSDTHFHYTYDENGNLLKKTRGNQTMEEYTYDENGNLIKSETASSAETFPYYTYEYIYDERGTLIREISTAGTNPSAFINYNYDENGNLISKVRSLGTTYTTYTYDVNGNLIKYTSFQNGNPQIYEMDYLLVYLPDGMPEQIEEIVIPQY